MLFHFVVDSAIDQAVKFLVNHTDFVFNNISPLLSKSCNFFVLLLGLQYSIIAALQTAALCSIDQQ